MSTPATLLELSDHIPAGGVQMDEVGSKYKWHNSNIGGGSVPAVPTVVTSGTIFDQMDCTKIFKTSMAAPQSRNEFSIRKVSGLVGNNRGLFMPGTGKSYDANDNITGSYTANSAIPVYAMYWTMLLPDTNSYPGQITFFQRHSANPPQEPIGNPELWRVGDDGSMRILIEGTETVYPSNPKQTDRNQLYTFPAGTLTMGAAYRFLVVVRLNPLTGGGGFTRLRFWQVGSSMPSTWDIEDEGICGTNDIGQGNYYKLGGYPDGAFRNDTTSLFETWIGDFKLAHLPNPGWTTIDEDDVDALVTEVTGESGGGGGSTQTYIIQTGGSAADGQTISGSSVTFSPDTANELDTAEWFIDKAFTESPDDTDTGAPFQTTIDSTSYSNGLLSIGMRATRDDATQVLSSAEVTVNNAAVQTGTVCDEDFTGVGADTTVAGLVPANALDLVHLQGDAPIVAANDRIEFNTIYQYAMCRVPTFPNKVTVEVQFDPNSADNRLGIILGSVVDSVNNDNDFDQAAWEVAFRIGGNDIRVRETFYDSDAGAFDALRYDVHAITWDDTKTYRLRATSDRSAQTIEIDVYNVTDATQVDNYTVTECLIKGPYVGFRALKAGGYVDNFKILSDELAGWTYTASGLTITQLATPTDITPGTAGSWQTVTFPSPPSDDVVIAYGRYRNEHASNDKEIACRPYGDTIIGTPAADHRELSQGGWLVGLDSSDRAEFFTRTSTYVDLHGYISGTSSQLEVYSAAKTLSFTQNGTVQTVDISSQVTGTPQAVLVLCDTAASGLTVGFGHPDADVLPYANMEGQHVLLVGVKSDNTIDARVSASGGTFALYGQINTGVTVDTTTVNQEVTADGTWRNIPTAQGADELVYMHFYGGIRSWDVREEGFTTGWDSYFDCVSHSGQLVSADGSGVVEMKLEAGFPSVTQTLTISGSSQSVFAAPEDLTITEVDSTTLRFTADQWDSDNLVPTHWKWRTKEDPSTGSEVESITIEDPLSHDLTVADGQFVGPYYLFLYDGTNYSEFAGPFEWRTADTTNPQQTGTTGWTQVS